MCDTTDCFWIIYCKVENHSSFYDGNTNADWLQAWLSCFISWDVAALSPAMWHVMWAANSALLSAFCVSIVKQIVVLTRRQILTVIEMEKRILHVNCQKRIHPLALDYYGSSHFEAYGLKNSLMVLVIIAGCWQSAISRWRVEHLMAVCR